MENFRQGGDVTSNLTSAKSLPESVKKSENIQKNYLSAAPPKKTKERVKKAILCMILKKFAQERGVSSELRGW